MKKKNGFKTFEKAFIVKDAKTYTNAEEAWYQFHGKQEGCVLFIIVPRNVPQNVLDIFEEVVDSKKWESVIWFESFSNYAPRSLKRKMRDSYIFRKYRNGREYIYNLLDRIRLDRLGKKITVETVFSGHRNTQEHLAYALKPKELYIMDSGMGIQKRVQGTGYINDRKVSKRKPVQYILYKIIGFQVFDREKTKLFTVYNESVETNHKVIENDYSYRKMLVKSKQVGDVIFFVSSPIYNREHISIEKYMEFVKEIFEELNLKPENVVYIPHPVYESEEVIQWIVNQLGCREDSRDIPIETKITMYDTLPKMCVSPYSSSIVNIASYAEDQFEIVYAWHPELDCFKEMKRWKEQSILKMPYIKLIELRKVSPLFDFDEKDCEQLKYKNFEEWDAALKLKSKM